MTKETSFSKIVGSAGIGNVLEYYDFTLFVFLAPHISHIFFPTGNNVTAMIAGLGVYAMGYFIRPLGAIIFGKIGDTYGRKQALTLSIMVMGIPTVLIGCLPSYQSIGILSPLLLTLCRLFQGLSVGGENTGAGIFTIENVQTNQRIFAGSLITSSSAFGGLLGSSVAGFVLLPFMPSWAWRGAFIVGALIAIFGLYVRLHVIENNPIKNTDPRSPFREVLKNHPRSVFCVIGIAAFTGIMYNLTLTYLGVFLATFKNWPLANSLGVVSLGTIVYIILVPSRGYFVERIGVRKIMIASAIATMALIYPIFWVLTVTTCLYTILIMTTLLVVLTATFHAPINFYMASLFPPSCRYSGVALSYSIGMAIFGGTTSMILASLVHWTNNPLFCVVYVIFGAFLALLALVLIKPPSQTPSLDDPLFV
jgi:MHS family proline/betaine transporter-like MFS transporter